MLVLTASHAGALLYPRVGYGRIGTLLMRFGSAIVGNAPGRPDMSRYRPKRPPGPRTAVGCRAAIGPLSEAVRLLPKNELNIADLVGPDITD
jgi:hypothetical protein